jgi:ribosome recycling factor
MEERALVHKVMHEAEVRMRGAVTALESDLQSYRTGRASPHVLDRLEIETYGALVPLNQLAAISVPEPQQLAIRPYDPHTLSAIEKAILKSDLGLTPNNDGKIIRLNIPRLTEERRRDLGRQVNKRVEDGKVAIRNVRRDSLGELRRLKDAKSISENQFFITQDDLQELTDKYSAEVEELGKKKEAEIMEV